MVVCACNLSTLDVEGGRIWVGGHTGLYSESISLKPNNQQERTHGIAIAILSTNPHITNYVLETYIFSLVISDYLIFYNSIY